MNLQIVQGSLNNFEIVPISSCFEVVLQVMLISFHGFLNCCLMRTNYNNSGVLKVTLGNINSRFNGKLFFNQRYH